MQHAASQRRKSALPIGDSQFCAIVRNISLRIVVPKVAGSSPVGHPLTEVPVDETARVRVADGDFAVMADSCAACALSVLGPGGVMRLL